MSLSSIGRFCCVIVLTFVVRQAFAQEAPDSFAVNAVEIVVAEVRVEAEAVADLTILATRADLLAKLKQPVSFDFFEEPLSGVAEYMRDNVRINVPLDGPGLDLAGITSDEPFTMSLSAVSGEQALDQLLAVKNCTYVIRDSILLFTSLEAALEDPATDSGSNGSNLFVFINHNAKQRDLTHLITALRATGSGSKM